MGLFNDAVLVLLSTFLAYRVAALWPRRGERADAQEGRRRPVGSAVAMGGLVLALALLNVFQLPYTLLSRPAYRPKLSNWVLSAAPKTEPLLKDGADQETLDRFGMLFYEKDAWRHRNWFGIATFQNPNDVWMIQEIMVETRPDFIIEAGTAAGGSAVLWGMILREVNPDGKVITLDVAPPLDAAVNHPIWKERVEFILGSSTDPATVAKLAERTRGKRVLVILDSDHRKAHVLNELKAYSPMVNVGSYLLVQDTNVNGHPALPEFGPGPMEALDEFLATNSEFQIDRSREALLFTLHPRGYLKRVK